jgi:hypothetical protein
MVLALDIAGLHAKLSFSGCGQKSLESPLIGGGHRHFPNFGTETEREPVAPLRAHL